MHPHQAGTGRRMELSHRHQQCGFCLDLVLFLMYASQYKYTHTHRLFGGGSSSPRVSRPSLGSALIAAARALLWSSFRRRSESPLLAHRETKRQEKVSCLFGSCRLFPGLTSGYLWCTKPFRLCSRRQLQSSPCDPTEAEPQLPAPPAPAGEQTSLLGC